MVTLKFKGHRFQSAHGAGYAISNNHNIWDETNYYLELPNFQHLFNWYQFLMPIEFVKIQNQFKFG